MRQFLRFLLLGLASAGGCAGVGAQTAANKPARPVSAPAALPAPAASHRAAGLNPDVPNAGRTPGVSKLVLAVVQLGALRCAERAEQVSKFLSRGSGEMLIVDRPTRSTPGAAEMVTATLLVPTEAGKHSTVSISLFPTDRGCSASYSAISHEATPCDPAEKKLFPGLVFKPLPDASHRLALIGEVGRVLSQEVPGGCLLMKHEVIR